ncbi:MAG: hypothetical protein D3904_08200 [Candidatus Electrothrix sp. EH2]|nr:hypothetical protein [Candidatus Electrothrix sp. EH2]
MNKVSSVISIREQGAFELIRSLLHQGISVRVRVSGRSMQPLLKDGDIVELAPVEEPYPRIGDIVFFRDQSGNPLLHRLIRRRYRDKLRYLQTKGDACGGFDSFVPEKHIIGYVRRITGKGQTVDLQTTMMRFAAWYIVVRSLTRHSLYSIVLRLKKRVSA